MTPGLFVLVALCGGVGSVLRFVLDGAIGLRWPGVFPWGTVIINLSGSLLLGLVTGLASVALVSPATASILGTGLLGGYTTFSTATVETVRLWRAGWRFLALLQGFGVLVLAVAAALAGYALATAL